MIRFYTQNSTGIVFVVLSRDVLNTSDGKLMVLYAEASKEMKPLPWLVKNEVDFDAEFTIKNEE